MQDVLVSSQRPVKTLVDEELAAVSRHLVLLFEVVGKEGLALMRYHRSRALPWPVPIIFIHPDATRRRQARTAVSRSMLASLAVLTRLRIMGPCKEVQASVCRCQGSILCELIEHTLVNAQSSTNLRTWMSFHKHPTIFWKSRRANCVEMRVPQGKALPDREYRRNRYLTRRQ
jgi:hypothetical protein